MSSVEWGTVGQWVSAAVAGGAFAVALLWTPRAERRRFEAGEARLVAAYPLKLSHKSDADGRRSEGTFVLWNGSPRPISEVRLEVWSWDHTSPRMEGTFYPRWEVIRPDSRTEPIEMPLVPPPEDSRAISPPLGWQFMDADGQLWRREPGGPVRRVKGLSILSRGKQRVVRLWSVSGPSQLEQQRET